jgi:hypothetical protein
MADSQKQVELSQAYQSLLTDPATPKVFPILQVTHGNNDSKEDTKGPRYRKRLRRASIHTCAANQY